MRNTLLPSAIHSLSAQILLSMLLALRQLSHSSLSPDPTLHGRIFGKVLELCTELGVSTTSDAGKSLGLVMGIAVNSGGELVSLTSLYEVEY